MKKGKERWGFKDELTRINESRRCGDYVITFANNTGKIRPLRLGTLFPCACATIVIRRIKYLLATACIIY